jgi:ABC-type transport system substrate-binding protein
MMQIFKSQPDRTGRPLRARLVGAIAVGAVLSLALAACGGSATTSSSGSAGEYGMTGLAGDKAEGDTLTIGELNAPNSLDPAQVFPQADFTMLTYESLTYLDQDGEVQPALATSWEYVGEGNTDFTMDIRTDATFSDGEKVTPDAVVKSLQYVQNTPGAQSAFLAGATFAVSGENTVEVKLGVPNPVLPQLFSQIYSVGAIISPKALEDPSVLDAAHTSYGAGRYIYQPDQSVAGDHYTYTANPDFYDQSLVYFKTITLKVVANADSMINAVKTGQIDVAKGDYAGITNATAAGLQAVGGPTNTITLNLMDREGVVAEPLADVRVRQALNYAIDRDAITSALVGEYGQATTQFALEGGDGYSDAVADAYPYDPEKAKELLAEAGYPDGFEMDVVTAVFAGFNDMGEALKGQLAEVGVTLNLDQASDGMTYVTNVAGKKYPAAVGGQSALPMYFMGLQLFMVSPNQNPFNTNTPELTTLFNGASAADPDERADLDQQIAEYLSDNAWFVPVAATPIVYFGASTIGGMKITANNTQASPLDWYRLK